jgi:hypothetical protein
VHVAAGGDQEDLHIVINHQLFINTAAPNLPHAGIDDICNAK